MMRKFKLVMKLSRSITTQVLYRPCPTIYRYIHHSIKLRRIYFLKSTLLKWIQSDRVANIYIYIDLDEPKSGALVVFQLHTILKTAIKLFSTGCRRVSSRGFKDQLEGWWGRNDGVCNPRDDILTTCKASNTHASQRCFQTAEDLWDFI